MSSKLIRHFFPGGNTPQGFVSYYDYVINQAATRIFILKGGPGTGKSTFMKRIGKELGADGFMVEHHHCSSDNHSLDALVIPALNIALIDGTSPHIVDPKNPGCIDEIIHLGDYWNEAGIVKHKADILACNANIKNCFQRSYRLLRAAKVVYDDWEAINTAALDIAAANTVTADLITTIFSKVHSVGYGKIRKLFASAITPNGSVHYLDSLIDFMPTCYIITGSPGTGKSSVIQRIAVEANSRGLDIELFFCPFDPLKPEHLVVPSLGIVFITSAEPHTVSTDNAVKTVNMDECLKYPHSAHRQEMINYDKNMYQELLAKAVTSIQQAKQFHDELEGYYIPYMDFSSIESLWEKTLQRIRKYAD